MLNQVKKYAGRTLAVVGTVAAAPMAMADAPDYTSITTAVDWSTVSTGIITVFAAGAAVLVAFVGGKFLLRAIRGA